MPRTAFTGTIALLTALALAPAQAMVTCPTMESLSADLTQLADTGSQASGQSCQHVLEPEGRAIFCYQSFPLRSDAATTAFQEKTQVYTLCFGAPEKAKGPDVNHPDSYTSLHFTKDGRRLTLSLKDKSTLNSTLVTTRIAPEGR